MARDLKLQVILDAADKATAPLKKITQGSSKTADALRSSKEALRALERQQRDLGSFRKLKEATRENGEALAAAQERLRNMRGELKRTDAPTEKFQRQFKQASDEVERLSGKLGDQRRRLGELRNGLRQGGVSTDNLGRSEDKLAEQIRAANTQFDEQKRKMREVAQRQKRLTEAQQRYHRTIGQANNMTGAGFTAAATGGAALYGASQLLAPGVQYGETMSRVQALTRTEKGDEQFKALKEQARALGSSTAFSASQVGQGQAFLAMAGFTPKAIRTSMSDMLNLALAGGLDLGRTADISSNILSGFGLAPDQMGRVSDVLTATTTRANVDLEMLGNSMKYVAPQARAMGLSLEQAAAMAGMLGNVGIQGSQAGTTLRAMMTRLAAPTAAASSALKTLGVNAQDAQGDLRDVPSILADIAKASADMGNAERAGYLKDIFGEEPGAGMAELIAKQGTAGIEKFTEIISASAGESARVAKTMTDNIAGDLKGLNSAWEEVGISLTQTNKGPLRDLIQTVTAITRGIGNWIKANPELASVLAKVAAVLATVVAVGGALTVMLTSILGPIAAVRYAMTLLSLNPAALTIMGIVAAVAALAGAAYLIYKNWGAISDWFAQRWADVKAAFSGGIGSVMRLLLNWNPIGLLYRGITAGLAKLGIEIPAKFTSLGSAIVDGLIGGLTGKLAALKDKVVGMASDVKGWFAGVLDINSPSRVFARFGGYTVDGLNVGLDAQRDEPARRVAEIAKRVQRAGAGLALGAATLPAAASPDIAQQAPIQFDNRPPLAAGRGQQSVDNSVTIGDIHVQPAPGMDERQLAQYVAQEVQRALEDAQREQAARRRSSLHDIE
ncbi:TP901 family phage tail tape measure protein [Chromohalobacter marismortui]|uniref:TP901 family phage tail tape measure protein n=1 Tax=Chromohalobacter marismortui TaxID=42055 RepID=A0A4R7NQN3_9GAMM|nr:MULTISPECIES: phage tail tape measure protein [Chromohalobacter]MCI0508620.1 phage tail tape measure protein [Chromohalobacter sp.]TDU23098.1 TP901 family phage tail tape measure protein [Chromohalobacter marismortui]